MKRAEALVFLRQNLKNENLIKHSLAVEAAMRKLADRLGQDSEKWGLAGLLHDIDYEQTKDEPKRHSLVGAEMVLQAGVSPEVAEAIKTHNEIHGLSPESLMARALYCLDPLTGLIVASTLVLPSKKIADLTADSVLKRFQEKAFARGANREIISKCQEYLDLSLEQFTVITLEAMQEISDDLGL